MRGFIEKNQVDAMNSNTKSPQKTNSSTLTKYQLNFTPTLNGVEENADLTAQETAWLERWENEHLAYADIDLHY